MAKKKTSTKPSKDSAKKKAPRFEDSLAELEQIVTDLESGNLPLSESIQRYEDGVKLLKQCHLTINQVQRKIELLTQVDDQGHASTVPFDDSGASAIQPIRAKTVGKKPVSKSENQSDVVADSSEDVDESGRLF